MGTSDFGCAARAGGFIHECKSQRGERTKGELMRMLRSGHCSLLQMTEWKWCFAAQGLLLAMAIHDLPWFSFLPCAWWIHRAEETRVQALAVWGFPSTNCACVTFDSTTGFHVPGKNHQRFLLPSVAEIPQNRSSAVTSVQLLGIGQTQISQNSQQLHGFM